MTFIPVQPTHHASAPAKLLLMLTAAVLLLLSWRWPETRALWDAADRWLFYGLNLPMATHHSYALTVALLNMRAVDALVGLLLFGYLLRAEALVPHTAVRAVFLRFFCLLVWMVLLRILFAKGVAWCDWGRASPTLILPDAVQLHTLFPDWDTQYHMKTNSNVSFPGDHASVVMLWAMYVSRYSRPSRQAVAWSVAICVSLPRLAGGAHWLSDDLVGGLFVTWVAYATMVYTPCLNTAGEGLERCLRPVLKHLAKVVPVLKRCSLLHGL